MINVEDRLFSFPNIAEGSGFPRKKLKQFHGRKVKVIVIIEPERHQVS